MWILFRAATYSVLFIGLLLVFLPARLLSWTGMSAPTSGPLQVIGIAVAIVGGVIALWCILSFVFLGRGTPFPLDPPRKLVTRGPYRFVRNPMYLGAALALAGAAVLYKSIPLLSYAILFIAITHLFVLFYEEPTLRKMFGDDYNVYCSKVGRWWPKSFNYPN